MWRKAAHYFYSDGNEIVIHVQNRAVQIRHPDGSFPFDPACGKCCAHPDEKDRDALVLSYEEVGLYYGYQMAGTGWDGDC